MLALVLLLLLALLRTGYAVGWLRIKRGSNVVHELIGSNVALAVDAAKVTHRGSRAVGCANSLSQGSAEAKRSTGRCLSAAEPFDARLNDDGRGLFWECGDGDGELLLRRWRRS